eukprot:TRINITY_DN975_c0_g1_i2.p1 TRINITY_DN975_c0_g1~~TRINITY_DN975_c0_g1_i2.p1  ORF type:complete len:639 (-),score=70.65 TRINITY_DN975_c0_g1_i2:261-2177(-)
MRLRRWQCLLLLVLLQQSLRGQQVCSQGVTLDDNTTTTYRIDCGGVENFTSPVGQQWLADIFYTGGQAATISQSPAAIEETTVRYFSPQAYGYKNCYQIPVPNGRYNIRMYRAYLNYDNRKHDPAYDVSVEGTVVFSFDSPWLPDTDSGAYSNAYAFIRDGEATICFYSEVRDVPLVGALELVQVDPASYGANETGSNIILLTYARVTASAQPFGSGLTSDGTNGGRVWYAPQVDDLETSDPLKTDKSISNTNVAPNDFPELLYQYARIGTPSMTYTAEVDANFDYSVWLHFAEIDPSIAPGQRIFNVSVNGVVYISGLDIMHDAGGAFVALDKQILLKNLTTEFITLKFIPISGYPLISAVEIFAILPEDAVTDPLEAKAMHSLKVSLQIPGRMGWNGDPCAPNSSPSGATWDAWEGVTCDLQDNNTYFISALYVPDAGLSGYIDSSITLLAHLKQLNLSNNNLNGSIPSGLGMGALTSLDLSFNKLTGNIPESLGSQQLRTVILNDNQLEGEVPSDLYAMGVNGGSLDILHNKGLCGVSGLPDCPSFWDKGSLSKGAKAGIVLGTIMLFVLLASVVCLCIQRRRRHDYSFRVSSGSSKSKSSKYIKHGSRPRTNFDDMQIMRNVPSRFGFSNLTPL